MSKESEIIKDLMLTRCANWQEVAEFLYFDMGYTAKEVQEIKEKERPTWEYYESFSWNERINIIYKEQQEDSKFDKLLKESEREVEQEKQRQQQHNKTLDRDR